MAEAVRQISHAGGCQVCDAGRVAHTIDGVAHLCDLHLDGRHDRGGGDDG